MLRVVQVSVGDRAPQNRRGPTDTDTDAAYADTDAADTDTIRTRTLNRLPAGFLPLLLLFMLPLACGWHGEGEVALRQLPYPYEAGVALEDGGVPACLAERGIRFADTGERVRTAGQDAACSLVDRGRQLWESVLFLYERREWRGSSFFTNRLVEPSTDENGATSFTFKTYVGSIANLPAQMPSDVAAQVAGAVMYELKAKGGVMILGGRDGGPARPVKAVMDRLTQEHEQGAVFVTERDRLLAYSFVRRYLDWGGARTDGGVTITIRSVDDGAGHRWIPTLAELDGITFYTPDPENTRVIVGGEAVENLIINGEDRTRRGSVTVWSSGAATGSAPGTAASASDISP